MAQKNSIFGKTALIALALFIAECSSPAYVWATPSSIDQEVLEPQSPGSAPSEPANTNKADPVQAAAPSVDNAKAKAEAETGPPKTSETSQPQYPDIRPPTRIMPSKITPLQNNSEGGEGMAKAAPEIKTTETVGQLELLTLQTPTTGNTETLKLVYDGPQDRSELLKLFKGLSPSSHSITMQESAVWLLGNLIPDSVDDSGKNKEEKEENDVYSLRLDKLMKFGELEKTLILYKMNEGQPPSNLAAKAGIVAMLARNEAAVACLEQKALPEDITNKDKAFWGKVDLFCKGLLSPAAGEDDQLRYSNAARIYITASGAATPSTLADYNKLDEVARLSFAEKGVIPADMTASTLKQLDTLSLALILSRKHAIPAEKLALLLAEGVQRGLLHSGNLGQIAQDLTDLKAAPDKPAKATPKTDVKTSDYSSKLIQFLNSASDLTNAKFADKIKDPIERSLAIAALREANDLPEGLDSVVMADQTSAKNAVILFAAANQVSPESWMAAALAINPPESSDKSSENKSGDDIFCEYFLSKGNDTDKARTALVTAIQPFLSSSVKSSTPQKDVYDNIFNLTDSSNYVMPSNDILSSLKKEANKKPSKQAVTESLSILSARPVENLHPAALYRVLNVLKSAGLSVQTKSLGHEVLGHILEN